MYGIIKTQRTRTKGSKTMTEKMAKQIKKILKNENVNIVSTYFDRYADDSKSTLRIKVIEFIESSNYEHITITPISTEQKKKETQDRIIKVLMALSNNGLRPAYKTEQRINSNMLGKFDCRYIIFE